MRMRVCGGGTELEYHGVCHGIHEGTGVHSSAELDVWGMEWHRGAEWCTEDCAHSFKFDKLCHDLAQ